MSDGGPSTSGRRRAAWTAVAVALVVAGIVALWPRDDDVAETRPATAPESTPAPRLDVPAKPTPRPRRTEEATAPDETPSPAPVDEAPAEPRPPEPTPSSTDVSTGIAVVVVDENGRPVPDVLVAFRSSPRQMDSFDVWRQLRKALKPRSMPESGRLVVPVESSLCLDGLTFDVIARTPSHPPSVPVPVTVRAGSVADVRVVVARARSADVRVVDADTGAPVAGALVVSTTESDRLHEFGTKRSSSSGRTDGAGRCTLSPLGAGEHEIEVSAEGHERAAALWNGGPLLVRMAPYGGYGSVEVVVTGPDGAPAPGVVVTCCEYDLTSRTDAAGRAVFDRVPAESRLFSIDRPTNDKRWTLEPGNGLTWMEHVDVLVGERVRLELGFRRRTAGVILRLRTEDGASMPRTKLRLFGAADFDASTDDGGDARFPDLPSGDYMVIVCARSKAEWRLGEIQVAENAQIDRTVTLGRGTIRGRVVLGATRAAVAGAHVTAFGPEYGSATADADGRFEISCARVGTYRVEAMRELRLPGASDGLAARSVEIVVPTSDEVVVELVESGKIVARFPADERVRAGKAWVIVRAGTHGVARCKSQTGEDDLLSEDIAPGRCEVVVEFEKRTARFPADVVAGKTTVVDVKLP